MRSIPLLVLACLPLVGLVACSDDGASQESAAPQPTKVTTLFTNIDVERLQATTRAHFSDVSGWGLQGSSKPGTPGGYMTITPPGRKVRRFQVAGEITAEALNKLLSELKTEVSSLIDANDATITGGIGASVQDRPIAYLTLASAGARVDCMYLLGFYVEYEDAGGTGAIDVMVTKIESADDEESWALGFVIHEPANAG